MGLGGRGDGEGGCLFGRQRPMGCWGWAGGGAGGEGRLIGDRRDWEQGRGGIWRTRMLNHKLVLDLICVDGGPIRW